MILNMKRLWLLMRNDMLINRQTIGVFAAALAAIILLFGIAFPAGASSHNFHPTLYLWILFIGGFYVTSMAFRDWHEYPKNYAFLTLPASNFEKFLSKLLLTSVGYVLITLVFYFILSLLVVGISSLLFPHSQYIFNPLHDDVLWFCGVYIILQAIFFLGSVYFKKHALIKTILVLSLCAIVFSLFSLILTRMFWGYNPIGLANAFWHIIKMIFWIIAPCCWIVAYIRLREIKA